MAALLDRARLLVAGGPHVANIGELIAVHAAIYPAREPVCDHCPAEQGKAYYAIQRWVNQQENSLSTSISPNVKKGTTARFHSDQLIYTPHGLGVAYSNDNLTDKAARDILKADPDAAQHFAVLPPAAEEGEGEQSLTPAQASTAKQVEKAQQPASTAPASFDYAKLASAMLDEMQRRETEVQAKRDAEEDDDDDDDQGNEQRPGLTASAGGAGEGDTGTEVTKATLGNGVEVTTGQPDGTAGDADHDEQPVRLSRMNKEQLLTAYRVELRLEPAEGLTNDQLRDAIAEHRAGQQDPE